MKTDTVINYERSGQQPTMYIFYAQVLHGQW